MLEKTLLLKIEQDMIDFAKRMASSISQPFSIYLRGQLGAGKTTFTRALLQSFGYNKTVKSPTYSLVEHYQIEDKTVFHFDLYRLAHPEELEFIGISDYFSQPAIIIIEWPERAESYLPRADLLINISVNLNERIVECIAQSMNAEKLLNSI